MTAWPRCIPDEVWTISTKRWPEVAKRPICASMWMVGVPTMRVSTSKAGQSSTVWLVDVIVDPPKDVALAKADHHPFDVRRRVGALDPPAAHVVLHLGDEPRLWPDVPEVEVEPLEEVVCPVPSQRVGEGLGTPPLERPRGRRIGLGSRGPTGHEPFTSKPASMAI